MRRRYLPIGALCLVLWTGCGGGSGSTVTSGIRGTTIREVVGGAINRPPSDSPLAGAIVTIQPSGGGQEITRATSDAQGNFAVPLPAGTYLVVPLVGPNQQAGLSVSSQAVGVAAGAFTAIQIKYILLAP